MIYFNIIVLAAIALASAGCFARPQPDTVLEYGTAEATEQLAADQGTELQFSLPVDELPDLASTYRFAPGDQLDLRLYGYSQHDRSGVKVDPSGHISWLGLEPVYVEGRTVEAVRADLEQRLKPLFRYPRVVCKPRMIGGHRYHLLGKVIDRGAYSLDRPLTLLDAISRARGIETGLQNGTTIEIADFNHSFLVRDGKRIPIDFQGLIQEGDLRYNIHVHPGDLIYFPSTLASEIYVLGNVRSPGAQAYAGSMTLGSALARRAGLSEEAYAKGILVTRGNLQRPTVYRIDYTKVLSGEINDFRLLPGDIIYVPDRPYAEIRLLARVALNAFVNAFASSAGGAVAREILE